MDDKKTLMFHGGQAINAAQPSPGPAASQPATPSFQPPAQQHQAGYQVGYGMPPQGQAPQQMHPPAQQPPQPAQQNAGPPPGYPAQHQQAPQHGRGPHQHEQYQQHRQQQQQQQQPKHQQWGNFPKGNPLAGMANGPITRKKIIMAIVGAIGLAILSTVGIIVKNKVTGGKADKYTISYGRLGIKKKSANVDELIGKLESHARKWRRDATWWGLSMYGVRPDGTVDLTDNGGAAKVKFVSAKGVQSAAKRVRKDSIKEYSMTRKGARSNKMIGAKKPWKNFQPIGIPNCKVNDLVKALGARGFKDGTVRVGFDTKFAFGTGWAWTVDSKDKKLAGFYSMDDCSFIKER